MKIRLVYISLLCLLLSSCQLLEREEMEFSTNTESTSELTESAGELSSSADEVTTAKESLCYVYICGQVKTPGVYTLEAGKRVDDLVKMAGGFTEDADLNSLNLARVLVDGEQIYVLSKEEAKTSADTAAASESAAAPSGTESQQKININTATKEELMTLSGIGEAKADSIISYRQTNGPFSSIEEIKQIEGIKDGIFLKIKDQIIV